MTLARDMRAEMDVLRGFMATSAQRAEVAAELRATADPVRRLIMEGLLVLGEAAQAWLPLPSAASWPTSGTRHARRRDRRRAFVGAGALVQPAPRAGPRWSIWTPTWTCSSSTRPASRVWPPAPTR
ncbi:hypothetical protein LP420_40480 [Massilia sp. B-10]|nr:hypothetical protein LP420_40480 [Massilia sp. B-10]